MIDSTQHLTNQQSDALTGSWMQVERFPQNKRRLMLHLKVGMFSGVHGGVALLIGKTH